METIHTDCGVNDSPEMSALRAFLFQIVRAATIKTAMQAVADELATIDEFNRFESLLAEWKQSGKYVISSVWTDDKGMIDKTFTRFTDFIL